MVIIDHSLDDVLRAAAMVAASPNPRHAGEYRAVTGEDKPFDEVLADSIQASVILGCSLRGGDAMIGGVVDRAAPRENGPRLMEIWMLATAGARRRPRWMIREGRRFLEKADDEISRLVTTPCVMAQAIPQRYRAGVAYAEHLGFRVARVVPAAHEPFNMISVMERNIANGRRE